MKAVYFKKSLLEGYKSLKSWVAFFGLLVAVVTASNFVVSVFTIELSTLIEVILSAYRDIVHRILDFITFPFDIILPEPIKDVVFFYFLIGGSFMRSRMSEDIYSCNNDSTIRTALRGFVFEKEDGPGVSLYTGRLYLMYQNSPNWLRKTMDCMLWPRVAKQYFENPRVYLNIHGGTFQTFDSSYPVSSKKEFMHDRRVVILFQGIVIVFGVLFVLILNGFLSMPK